MIVLHAVTISFFIVVQIAPSNGNELKECTNLIDTTLGQSLIVERPLTLPQAMQFCKYNSGILFPVHDNKRLQELSKLLKDCYRPGTTEVNPRFRSPWLVGLSLQFGVGVWTDGVTFTKKERNLLYGEGNKPGGLSGCEESLLYPARALLSAHPECSNVRNFICLTNPVLKDVQLLGSTGFAVTVLGVVIGILACVFVYCSFMLKVAYFHNSDDDKPENNPEKEEEV